MKASSLLAVAIAALSVALPSFAATNKLVLNEANCVSGDKYLEVSGSGASIKIGTDTGMIGTRLQGNGNNWLELLVAGESNSTTHTLDLRGYTIQWHYDKGDGNDGAGTITFASNAFAAVPKGTLLTISEFAGISYDTATDATDGHGGHKRWAGVNGYGEEHSYVSGKGITDGTFLDLTTGAQNSTWHQHFWAGDTTHLDDDGIGALTDEDANGAFAYSDYFIFRGYVNDTDYDNQLVIGVDQDAGLFVANNDNWGMRILDASGNVVMDWVGEDEANYGGGGVASTEVFKLQAVDVTASGHATYNYAANYSNLLMADGKESTMGVENKWSSGTKVQDLTSLR